MSNRLIKRSLGHMQNPPFRIVPLRRSTVHWKPNLTTRMLSERHPCTSSVENDHYERLTSCASPMECIDCLRNRLSRCKALLLAIPLSFKGQFSGDDVGSAWHRM